LWIILAKQVSKYSIFWIESGKAVFKMVWWVTDFALMGLADDDFGKPSQSDKEKPKVFLFMTAILLFHIGQFSYATSLYSTDCPAKIYKFCLPE
jgi:predicted secreted protein